MIDNPAVAQQAEAMTLKVIKSEFESLVPDQILIGRLLNKSQIIDNCLIWQGSKRYGYGNIEYQGEGWTITRLIFSFKNKLTPKIYLCHIKECSSKSCIRPSHLYLGNAYMNTKDEIDKGRFHFVKREGLKGKEYCKKGHALSKDNIRVDTKGTIVCKICHKLRARIYRLNQA